MMFCSFPQEEVMSLTASFLRASRSFRTPSIMRSGISRRRMRPPTPRSFSMELLRRLKNGCDLGSGGGASGIEVKARKSVYLGNNNTFSERGIAERIGNPHRKGWPGFIREAAKVNRAPPTHVAKRSIGRSAPDVLFCGGVLHL